MPLTRAQKVLVEMARNHEQYTGLELVKALFPAHLEAIVKAAKENGSTISTNGTFCDYFTIPGTDDTHCFYFHAQKGVVTCAEKMSVEETAERLGAERKAEEAYAAEPLRQCPTCLEWKKDFAIGGACFSCPFVEPRFITVETMVVDDL
jgi:hypothetical protein